MESSRVLIGALSPIQQTRVRSLLESQPDMDVIGPIPDAVELMIAVRELEADAVFLPMEEDGAEPGLCSHLLAEFPGLLVMAISADGSGVFMFQQSISRRELINDDDATLRTIRSVKARE